MDVFDDTCEPDTCGWHAREHSARVTDGFRTGLEVGQERTLQSGFNAGFSEAMHWSFQLAALRGILTALLGVHLTGSTDQKQMLEQKLSQSGDRDNKVETSYKQPPNSASNIGSQTILDNKVASEEEDGSSMTSRRMLELTEEDGMTSMRKLELTDVSPLYSDTLVGQIEDLISRLSEGEESVKSINNLAPMMEMKIDSGVGKDQQNPIRQLQTAVNLDDISSNLEKTSLTAGGPNSCCNAGSCNCSKGDDTVDTPQMDFNRKGHSVVANIEKLTSEAKELINLLGMGHILKSL